MRVGVDILKIKRIEEVYLKHGERFLDRILTEKEKEILRSRRNFKEFINFIAGRFSAKEAVMKSIGFPGRIRFKEIEILRDEYGRPYVNFYGKTKDFASNLKVDVSISHDGDYVVSFSISY